MNKNEIKKFIAETVKKAVASSLSATPSKKTVSITKKQLREGIARAVAKSLAENAMAMSPPMAAQPSKPVAPEMGEGVSDGDQKFGTSTFGQVPSPDVLQKMLSQAGGWDMTLRGSDKVAFDAAMQDAGLNPHRALELMQTGDGMHKILTALVNYSDGMGDEAAASLASSILDVLGWEWI